MNTDTATSARRDKNSSTPPDNNRNSIREMAQPTTPGNRTGPNLENPRSPQRQRSGFTPYDLTLVGNRRFLASKDTDIGFLSSDQVDVTNMNKVHITGQIIRIVSPIANTNAYVSRSYNTQVQQITYHRLILMRVHNDSNLNENSVLFYLMITRDDNNRLFHRDLDLRDNGVITIGTYLRILSPSKIEKFMQGIPLVVTQKPAIVMRAPTTVHSIPINTEIHGDLAVSSILNGIKLASTRLDVIHTTCSGLFCDKQRVYDWNSQNRGCGCYSKNDSRTTIALCHTIVVDHGLGRGIPMVMTNFSSNKFNNLYLTGPIPATVSSQSFDNDTLTEVEDSIEQCLEYINLNGGFTIVLWYRRGSMNDTSLIGQRSVEDRQTDAGTINYHIVEIIPTNRSFIDPRSTHSRTLKGKMFNTSNMRYI
jgi:hypothetical protein